MENMVKNKKKFWHKKKVLITGHTGFKGSWLCLYLNYLGAKVIGYSLPAKSYHKLFSLLKIKKKISYNYYGDISDNLKLKKIIKNHKPEIIFHLAAQPFVIDSYLYPKYTIETNVNGTLNILDSFKNFKFIKSAVIVTSDKCYKINKNQQKVKNFKEEDPLAGEDPYSASKACAEILTHSYISSFNRNLKYMKTAVSTARSGNIIGGGDWGKNRLMTDISKTLLTSKVLKIRNLNSTRPWIHVLDSLSGYILLAEKNYKNNNFVGSWNFSPLNYKKMKVVDILNFCIKKNYLKKNQIQTAKSIYKETKILNLNSLKAKKNLKWEPKLNFENTMRLTLDWYMAYKKGLDMDIFSKNQIISYLNKSK